MRRGKFHAERRGASGTRCGVRESSALTFAPIGTAVALRSATMKHRRAFVNWAVLIVSFLSAAAFARSGEQGAERSQAQPPLTPRRDRAMFMRQHFELVTGVHEALVRGDLTTARRQASILADRPDPQDLPAGAAPYVETMRLAAARAAAAVELEDVAAAASAMLATCGDCHRAVGTMPAHALPPSPTVGGQVGHMLAHQQAVDLMVQGLTVPSAWLWQSGAEALARAPFRKQMLPAGHKLTKDLLAAEQSVHHLAERARAATDQRSRIYVYSELVQSCATCHSRLGSVSGPDKK